MGEPQGTFPSRLPTPTSVRVDFAHVCPCARKYEAELSPVEQKLSSLRPALAQRPFFESPSPLGDVELYEYGTKGEDEDLPPS